jgi:hypothetical protein
LASHAGRVRPTLGEPLAALVQWPDGYASTPRSRRLRVGDAQDWWRVEEIVPAELLRLRAEMRLRPCSPA